MPKSRVWLVGLITDTDGSAVAVFIAASVLPYFWIDCGAVRCGLASTMWEQAVHGVELGHGQIQHAGLGSCMFGSGMCIWAAGKIRMDPQTDPRHRATRLSTTGIKHVFAV